ncbi:MAG: hypothetical protein QM733_08095 [Ilumatobacteraceae bacterium]
MHDPQLGVGSAAAVVITIAAELPAAAAATTLTNAVAVSSPTPDPVPGNNQASTTTSSSPSADVSIVKTGPATVIRGDTVTWTLTVANSGPSLATDVAVEDVVPAGVSGVTIGGVPDGTCTTAVACDLGDVAPGAAPIVITISGTLAADHAGSSLTNAASVTAATPDPDAVDNSSEVTSTVTSLAELTLTKSGPATVIAGDAIQWTIELTNLGPSVARDVVIDDVVPAGVTGAAALSTAGTCDATVSCQLGTVPVGGTATVTISAAVDPALHDTSITNTASATSPDAPGGQPVIADPVVTEVTRSADVVVTKTVTGGTVAGEAVAWTITVTNTGLSTADDVVVVDAIPAAVLQPVVTVDSGAAADACPLTAGTMTCALAALAPHSPVTITVVGTVDPAFRGQLANTATASSTTPDPDDGNSSATATSDVAGSAALVIAKAGPDRVVAGDTVTWTLRVRNDGPSTAPDVVVVDPVPAGVVVDAVDTSVGTCDDSVTCQLGTLTVGQQVTVRITGTLDPAYSGPTIVNGASASTTDGPTVEADDVTTGVDREADLAVTKVLTSGGTVAGEPVEWTITVSNAGSSTAENVTVGDPLPVALVGAAATPSVGTCDLTTGTLRCDLGTLPPRTSATVVVAGTVDADFRGVLTNAATAASDTLDPDGTDNTGTATSTVTGSAALTVTKTGSASAVAGGPIEWIVTVTNAGPSSAQDVVVHDAVPTGVVAVTASSSTGTCDATVTCRLGMLPVGGQSTITITGTVDAAYAGAAIENSASAETPDGPAVTSPPVSTAVSRSADVSISKVLASGGTIAGGPVVWTITVASAGPSTADEVVVTDTLPAALAGATATTSRGSCTIAGSTLTCALGMLAPSSTVTIGVAGTVAGDFRGALTNTASVASSTPDPDGGNATASVSSTVAGLVDLAVVKSVDRTQGLQGSPATFTVVASNRGPSTAANVVVDDQLPGGLTFVAARPGAGTFDVSAGRWTIGTLAAGATATLEIDVTLAVLGTHTNVVTVGQTPTGDEEIELGDNTASASIEVIAAGGELPSTGLGADRAVELALLLLAGGGVLMLVTKRRRRTRAVRCR